MQVQLETERQRADNIEKKHVEALETIKMMKLEVTERNVLQLVEYILTCLDCHCN